MHPVGDAPVTGGYYSASHGGKWFCHLDKNLCYHLQDLWQICNYRSSDVLWVMVLYHESTYGATWMVSCWCHQTWVAILQVHLCITYIVHYTSNPGLQISVQSYTSKCICNQITPSRWCTYLFKWMLNKCYRHHHFHNFCCHHQQQWQQHHHCHHHHLCMA